MSCELRDVSRKWPCTLGSTSAVYILRRRAMLPKDLPAFLTKWNIMASTKDNYFHHLPCANLVNSNTVAPALAQSLLSSHLWSMISFGHRLPTLSASLLGVGSFQTLVPKQRLLLRVKTWRNFLPQTMWAGTQSIFPFVFSGKSYGLRLSTPVSIPSYLHSSPNKCGSRQWQLLGLCHHTLML